MSPVRFAKHLKILEFAVSSMLRRRTKNAGLLVVFGAVVFLLSSIVFLTGALRSEALAVLDGAPQLILQRAVAGRHALIPVDYGKVIAGLPGVGEVKLEGLSRDEARRRRPPPVARLLHSDDLLWHGGEAAPARARTLKLTREQRAALPAFLRSL